MNRKGILSGVAVLLLSGMAVLVVQKARRDAAEQAGEVDTPVAGEDLETVAADKELLRVERESRDLGKPMTPERAAEKMREAMAVPQLNVRARMAGEIIRDLCQAGHAAAAWQMIDRAKGQVRDMELMVYFRYGKMKPAELLANVRGLEDGAEVRRALDGYLSGGTLEELHGVMVEPGFAEAFKKLEAGYPPGGKPLLVEIIRDRQSGARTDEDRDTVTKFARKMYDLKVINGSDLMEFVKVNDFRDIVERWEEIRALTAAEGIIYVGNPHRQALLRKLMDNPDKGLPVLLPREDEQGRADLLDAVRVWCAIKQEDAEKWVEDHAGGLKPWQREVMYAAAAKAAADRRDDGRAKEWAAKVTDGELRKGLPVK